MPCKSNTHNLNFEAEDISIYFVTLVLYLNDDACHMKFRTNTKAQTSAKMKITVHRHVNGMRKK
jgi:hypothetical protein